MSCRSNRSSVNWGADVARTPPRSAPPATSPECLALVADAEAAARYLATYGMKIRGATVEETEAARYALPTGAIPSDMYEPAGPWVDIYLSAGPNDEDGSCDVDDDSNCRLYRVRWNLVAGTAYEVVEISSSSGAVRPGLGDVQPTLSPDERSLAWIRRNGSSSRLLRQSHGEAGPTLVTQGTRDDQDRPEFPNWVANELLAFTTMGGDPRQGTLWYSAGGAAPIRWLGPGGLYASNTSFQDVDTHPSPAYRTGSTPRLVTHGGRGEEKTPRVTDLVGGQEEPFELGFEGTEAMCHHAAWNMEGTRILCHRASEGESLGGRAFINTLYEFRYDAVKGRWVASETSSGTDGRVFDVSGKAALDEVLFPPLLVSRCTNYFVKYAEWCGADEYVLATLYCADSQSLRASRVVVVTLHGPDGAPRIDDVTSAVEQAASGGSRLVVPYLKSWRGVFGTCSTAHQAPHWTPALP